MFCVIIIPATYAGVVQWLEFQPSKLAMWVRFPSPAPKIEVIPLGMASIFLFLVGIEQGRNNIYVVEENSLVDCFR